MAVRSVESCSLFNNSEGKGSFGSDEDPSEQRVEMYLAHPRETKGAWMGGANTPTRVCVLAAQAIQDSRLMGSSDEVHVVDALAITGDEGRGSLRKAAGSRQTGFDPQISEWGNPARKGYSPLNT